MSEIHDSDVWMLDRREIEAALLNSEGEGVMCVSNGCAFERFERNGEMAPIPYLRVTLNGVVTEAPLRNFTWVQFRELAA